MNNVQLFSIPKLRKLFIKRNAGCLLFTFGLAFTMCLVISLSVDFQDLGKVKFIFVFIFVNLN